MIKTTSVRTIRQYVIKLKAIAEANIFKFNESHAVNSLAQKSKKPIEERFADDLDYIKATADKMVKDFRATAEKATKNNPDPNATLKKFQKLLDESEDYKALSEKEAEILDTELAFGVDEPVILTSGRLFGKDISEVIPKEPVWITYRGQPEPVNLMKAIFDLEEAGLVKVRLQSGKVKRHSEEEYED